MTTLLDTSRRAIRERADAGWPLARIEDELIDAVSWLEPDTRAALWLWAWHCCAGQAPAEHGPVRLPDAA
jgi:hypothetical protein